MRFLYIYRSSDGIRHEEHIDADTRDAAFTLLREQGIRPIKVVAADGSKENGEAPRVRAVRRALLAVGAVLAAASAALVTELRRADPGKKEVVVNPVRYRQDNRAALLELSEKAKDIERKFELGYGKIDFDLLRNWAVIERLDNLDELYQQLELAREYIARTRAQMRALFQDVQDVLSSDDSNARVDTMRLYDKFMSNLDTDEDRLNADEYSLILLDSNREKWHTEKGRLVFTDPKFETEYRYFADTDNREDPAAARWRKDFGKCVIESQPVALPAALPKKQPQPKKAE